MKIANLLFCAFFIEVIAVACTGHNDAKTTQASSASKATSASPPTSTNLASLEVLSPGELATKIYNAFGVNMTLSGDADARIDYLKVNSANFVGSISNDPNNKYASSFTISYFIALAGLAQVVATNYSEALAQGSVINDCRQTAGAQSILERIAPTISSTELSAIASAMVTACAADPLTAVSAVVQSYSMALKSAL